MSSTVSGCPFLVQETVVAGEPVEVQVRVEDESEVNATMLGGAGRRNVLQIKHTFPLNSIMVLTHC